MKYKYFVSFSYTDKNCCSGFDNTIVTGDDKIWEEISSIRELEKTIANADNDTREITIMNVILIKEVEDE